MSVTIVVSDTENLVIDGWRCCLYTSNTKELIRELSELEAVMVLEVYTDELTKAFAEISSRVRG